MEFWKEVRRQVLTNELSRRAACELLEGRVAALLLAWARAVSSPQRGVFKPLGVFFSQLRSRQQARAATSVSSFVLRPASRGGCVSQGHDRPALGRT